jgi:hypothetical protein
MEPEDDPDSLEAFQVLHGLLEVMVGKKPDFANGTVRCHSWLTRGGVSVFVWRVNEANWLECESRTHWFADP